jgi:hypothetical protein
MSAFDADRQNGHDLTRTVEQIAPRTRRALTECQTVLPNTDPVDSHTTVDGAEGLVLVVSESGSEYVVDIEDERCECPDAQKRDVRCKHQRRAAFALGAAPIAADAAAALDLDETLGQHTDADLSFVAADGGVVRAGDNAELVDTGDERPEDCDCIPVEEQSGTPLECWPCRREGFTSVNPDAE